MVRAMLSSILGIHSAEDGVEGGGRRIVGTKRTNCNSSSPIRLARKARSSCFSSSDDEVGISLFHVGLPFHT